MRVSLHTALIVAHQGDIRFDGDKSSGNFVYSREATAEIHAKMNDPANYLGVDGKFMSSSMIEPVIRVLYNMSGPVPVQ